MKWWLLIALSCLIWSSAIAQLSDDFSDGDLTNNPEWSGQTNLFTVTGGELQLFDQAPGSSNTTQLFLPAPTSLDETTVWAIRTRLEFAPSGSNYARIYLTASQSDLTGSLNGYYLRVGGISGTDDALELIRQDGLSETTLITGTSGAVGQDPALASIRVTRTPAGEWSLEADYTGGTDYQLEGMATDDTHPMGSFFGLVCEYTSTRAEAFFFDDVLVDPLFMDTEPPVLLEAIPENATTLEVIFNEPLEPASGQNPAHYTLNNGIGSPVTATLSSTDPARVILELPTSLVDETAYELSTTDVADEAGNGSGMQSVSFTFLDIQEGLPYEILINEIMADPNPPVGLPEVEFIELYNRSQKTISLEGWTFSDGGSPAVFPPVLIRPDSFLLVTEAGEESALAPYGPVVGLSGFPGLNNGGDALVLANLFGETIHAVTYSSEWYGESDKDDGGWTLELINPLRPCSGESNWQASENLLGGTPGSINSQVESLPDTDVPTVERIFPTSASAATLYFSEALDAMVAEDVALYDMEGFDIFSAQMEPSQPRQVRLAWEPELVPGELYTLTIAAGIADCQLNANTDQQSIDFGLPVLPTPGDVVINELLYHPEVGGSDFVELYNRSDKVLNLNDFILGNIVGSSDSIGPVEVDYLWFPQTYVVVSESPADVSARYEVQAPQRMVLNDLPIFSPPAGNVTLYAETSPGVPEVIDAFDYSEDLHNELLDETRGVSLERIRIDGSSQDAGNWHSAAETVGYATPTAPNSQLQTVESPVEGGFFLLNERFSPDDDGYEDVLLLGYELPEAGFVANVKVFDAYGRWIQDLAQNQLLGREGQLKWEGQDANGRAARLGIYVVWVEYFHPDGTVRQEKLSCVLAGRLD